MHAPPTVYVEVEILTPAYCLNSTDRLEFQEHIPRAPDAMEEEVGAVCGCIQTSIYVYLSYGVPALQKANSGASCQQILKQNYRPQNWLQMLLPEFVKSCDSCTIHGLKQQA